MTIIEVTSPESNVLFDYVTVTFPVDDNELEHRAFQKDISVLFKNSHFNYFLSFFDVNVTDYTDDGKIPYYERKITYGENIVFKFNGPKDSKDRITHSLELKGEACREAERHGIDWHAFFTYIHRYELTVSTLHIACDLFTDKYFTIDQLLKKTKHEEFVSFSRVVDIHESKKNDANAGTTIYFGRRDATQIAIYDKKKERYYRGYDIDTNIWIRIEIRLKTNKTWDFIRLLVAKGMNSFPSLYLKILESLLEFKSRSYTDSNKRRWGTWRPWRHLIGSADKIKLMNQSKLESNLLRKREWLLNSAGKVIIEYFIAINSEQQENFFKELIDLKLKKIDNKSLTRINQYRLSNNLPIFSSLEILHRHILEKGIIDKELNYYGL